MYSYGAVPTPRFRNNGTKQCMTVSPRMSCYRTTASRKRASKAGGHPSPEGARCPWLDQYARSERGGGTWNSESCLRTYSLSVNGGIPHEG